MRGVAIAILVGSMLIAAAEVFGGRYEVIVPVSLSPGIGGIAFIYDRLTGEIEACALPKTIGELTAVDTLRNEIGCRRVR